MLSVLDGHGSEPTPQELEPLVGVHKDWWEDRDRIVLLDRMMLSDYPPDGSLHWECDICHYAQDLWGEDYVVPKSGSPWRFFRFVRAPGWRMLTSLSTCPNHHMRFPRYMPDSP